MLKKKSIVRVVAALLERNDGKILITQRRPKAFLPLKWEFPGGKVESGESDENALIRELKEELGIEVKVKEQFMSLQHSYPEFDVDFHVYHCSIVTGEPRKIAVHDFKWVSLNELDQFEFPPADQPTIRQLLE